MMKHYLLSIAAAHLLHFAFASGETGKGHGTDDDTTKMSTTAKFYTPKISGEWKHIYDPNEKRAPVNGELWYTNDHSFVFGSDGQWHCYGIIGWGKFTKQGDTANDVNPWTREGSFFHVTSKDLEDPKWEEHDYAMTAEQGVERVLWAPHVIKVGNEYDMFYNTGSLFANADQYASFGSLRRATSTDMFHWKRWPLNPLFSDPGHSRDSYVMKYKDTYYYYDCRVKSELDSTSCIAVRTSLDLDRWSGPQVVHEEPPFGHWGGNTESPTVIQYKGLFYLFLCYSSDYNKTLVYWSADPLHFPSGQLVTTLDTHAAEVIHTDSDRWYISNTGWDKKGLYLAKMVWE